MNLRINIKNAYFLFLCFLIASCASNNGDSQISEPIVGTELRTLPEVAITESSFPPYFSSIHKDILLNIQKGSPSSIQSAMSALRSNYNNSIEQADVLLAICSSILDYAWPSVVYSKVDYNTLPVNVYSSTLESIKRGIYENSFGAGDYFSLTFPSLVLFSDVQSTTYFENAKLDLEASLNIDNSSVLTLYLLGILCTRLGEYNEAEDYLSRAMTFDETNIDIIYAYFNVLLRSDNVQKAFDFSQTAISRFPTDTRILELSAQAAFNIKDFSKAESLIAQSLQFAPDNTALLLFRAKVLFELGDYLDVSSLLDVYSRTNSENKDYLILRAKLQSTWNKNIPSAVKTIQEALVTYPDDIDILLLAANLASTSAQKILNKTALDFLDEVLEKDPQNNQALQIVVTESILQQNWSVAYEASNIVISQGNISLISALQHTEICIELGFLSEARGTIDAFYSPNSEDEDLQQWYIRLLIAEGRYTNASDLIADLLPNSTGRMKSALYFERSRLQNTDERILSDLRTSLTSNPRNEFALFGLYLYYYERNDYSKAQYYLKQVIALNPANTDALQRNAELDTLLQ